MVSKQLATDLAGESQVINMAAVATERIIGASATATVGSLRDSHLPISVKSVHLFYVHIKPLSNLQNKHFQTILHQRGYILRRDLFNQSKNQPVRLKLYI